MPPEANCQEVRRPLMQPAKSNELKEIETTGIKISNQPDGDLENFNPEQLVSICMDLFQAGSETSSTTLSWAVMALALYPDVQEKCHKEIIITIGGKYE